VEAFSKAAGEHPQPLIKEAVTVVVNPVTFLCHRPFLWITHLGDPVRTVLDDVGAYSLAARSRPESVILQTVAVVVQAVANLRGNAQEGVAHRDLSINAIILLVKTLAFAALHRTEVFVHRVIAIVVLAVTDLGRRPFHGIAHLRHTAHAHRHRVLARAQTAGNLAQILIHLSVAIVVDSVAYFYTNTLLRVAVLWDATDAILNGVKANAEPAGGGAQVFIDQAVAVVVVSITFFELNTLHRLADLRDTTDAIVNGMIAHTQAAGGGAQILIHTIIAVVVKAVAHFHGRGVDGRIEGSAVRVVGMTVVVVIKIGTVFEPIQVAIVKTLVDEAVAVVVYAVANLLGAGIHVGVERSAVFCVGGAVAVLVPLTRIPHAVIVAILLPRVLYTNTIVRAVFHAVSVQVVVARVAQTIPVDVRLLRVFYANTVVRAIGYCISVSVGVASIAQAILIQVLLARILHANTIIRTVGDAVVVGVVVHAVSHTISIDIRESVVHIPVTIVVQAVADFGRTREHRRISRRTVGAINDAIVVVIFVHAVLPPVRVGVGGPFIHYEVAVVVLAVAQLLGAGMDVLVERSTVLRIRGLVVVVVQVADVAKIVQVIVLLPRVVHANTVIRAVDDAISIFVGLHAVSDPIVVGIFETLVGGAVAIVVLAVAAFRVRLFSFAHQFALVARILSGTGAELVGHQAGVAPGVLVNFAVAVVVLTVTLVHFRLRCRTRGQAIRHALAVAETSTPLVFRETISGRTFINVPLVALTFSLGPRALSHRSAGHIFAIATVVACRAIFVIVTIGATEVSTFPVIYAGLPGVDAVGPTFVVLRTRPAQVNHGRYANEHLVRHARRVQETTPVEGALFHAGDGTLHPVRGLDTESRVAVSRSLARIPRRAWLRPARIPAHVRQRFSEVPTVGFRVFVQRLRLHPGVVGHLSRCKAVPGIDTTKVLRHRNRTVATSHRQDNRCKKNNPYSHPLPLLHPRTPACATCSRTQHALPNFLLGPGLTVSVAIRVQGHLFW